MCLIPALVENMAFHTKTAIGARARTWRMYPYSCPSRQISPFLCSHTQNLSQECALAPRQKVIKRSWKQEKDRTFNLITLGFSNPTPGQWCDLFKRFGRVTAVNKSIKQQYQLNERARAMYKFQGTMYKVGQVSRKALFLA